MVGRSLEVLAEANPLRPVLEKNPPRWESKGGKELSKPGIWHILYGCIAKRAVGKYLSYFCGFISDMTLRHLLVSVPDTQ